eukprot:COSAG02_NODE_234_length_27784_cov_12.556872_16_plen_76_part_00
MDEFGFDDAALASFDMDAVVAAATGGGGGGGGGGGLCCAVLCFAMLLPGCVLCLCASACLLCLSVCTFVLVCSAA